MGWRDLGEPARGIGAAVTRAVDAAGDRDPDAYAQTVADLGALPGGYPGEVLGAVLRSLLEEQYPDGLDGDDIRQLLTDCYRGATGWLPPTQVDGHVLLAALASALGIHEPGVTYAEITAPAGPGTSAEWVDPVIDSAIGSAPGGTGPTESTALRVPTAAQYAAHAPVLIADLVAGDRRRLGRQLDAAFAEILRAETMELP